MVAQGCNGEMKTPGEYAQKQNIVRVIKLQSNLKVRQPPNSGHLRIAATYE